VAQADATAAHTVALADATVADAMVAQADATDVASSVDAITAVNPKTKRCLTKTNSNWLCRDLSDSRALLKTRPWERTPQSRP